MNASNELYTNPTDEIRHDLLKRALERQGRPEDFLYITSLLSPPPEITTLASPGSMKGVKVGIIGGGLAGLTAAFELRKMGADITILEAEEERIGGRVYTYYFDADKRYYAEFGPMRVPVSHETAWYYINLFQLNTESMATPVQNTFRYVHNTRLRATESVEENLYPLYDLSPMERTTPWNEITTYATQYAMMQLSPEVRAQMLQILPKYAPEYLPFINTSFRSYMEYLGLSQGAINLMYGLNPTSGTAYPFSYDETTTDNYSMDFMNVYRISNGFVNLPIAFLESFQKSAIKHYHMIPSDRLGSVIYKRGHLVTGINQHPNRPNKVQINFINNITAYKDSDEFDYVVCTLPFSALREVEIKPRFSNQKMQAIFEFNYIDAQKTAFLCNQRFWESNTPYGNINGGSSVTDLPIQFIVYPSDHIHSVEEQSILAMEPGVLIASYNLSQEAVRLANLTEWRRFQVIRQNVEEVHGLPRGYLNSIVDDFKTVHWSTEPNFRGGFAFALPGQKNIFSYSMLQPEYQNRVFFAGEHISTKHGWIQGALYTGKDAANQLLNSFIRQNVFF